MIAHLPFVSLILFALAFGWFLFVRAKTYLTFFQQEEYDASRFAAWMREKKARDRIYTLMTLAVAALFLMTPALEAAHRGGADLLFYATFAAFGALRARKMNVEAKKKLVLTQRAKKILALALALLFIWTLTAGRAAYPYDGGLPLVSVIAIHLVPYALMLANLLLKPAEKRLQKKFVSEAKQKLAQLNPEIVAITGSYGKTSTKHILAHILNAVAPTLATPGSVNTEMGITRIVRESLKPEHRYFIVEMGAYGPGSIARLCALTPPRFGLITAVGMAHYERFRTIDTVFDAKFELADAVKAQGGKLAVNAGQVPADRLAARRDETMILLGQNEAGAIRGIEESRSGLAIHATIMGEEVTLEAPLYGRHQAENIVLAAMAARALGVPMAAIKASIKTVPQIRHRLEVSLSSSGPSVIDDAYNANPAGFSEALKTLSNLTLPPGRRILITPGMVELGARHEEAHRAVGEEAGRMTDIVAVVTPFRIPSFIEGIKAAGEDRVRIETFAKQADAEAFVKAEAKTGDTILFANNLPDLYEASPIL